MKVVALIATGIVGFALGYKVYKKIIESAK